MDGRGHIPYILLNQRSRGNGGGACAQSDLLQSILQKAWMGLPLQQSVTQPVIARYVRLSASPCRLSRAHVNVFMQAVSTRSCVGKRCIVSALTRCVANINQDNRRFLRLSSVGSLPLAKNALHSLSSKY